MFHYAGRRHGARPVEASRVFHDSQAGHRHRWRQTLPLMSFGQPVLSIDD